MPVSEHTSSAEQALLAALRDGDEVAFRRLVTDHQPGLRRMARLYVPQAIVDDVVQETWIGVVNGIHRFEGRSSLKTWIYRILINQARKRGPRERRTAPFSARAPQGDTGPTVDPDRLVHPELGEGYWPAPPGTWHWDPEGRLLDAEARQVVLDTIETLSPQQCEVITLRDVEQWEAAETCEVLGLSAVNERVLLHRARANVRRSLEEYLHGA